MNISRMLAFKMKENLQNPAAAEPSIFVLKVALWGLKPGSNDSFRSADVAIRRDFTVGVWKGGFMVVTLGH